MRLVVGVGNPGERYARTRHNVAWRVLDELARRSASRESPGHASYRARRGTLAGHTLELLQPLTYMNRSGEALAAWRERNEREADLLVVTDDVYLPLGLLRMRAGGSSGGHRGLESIAATLGGEHFTRLRIGVGQAEDAAGLREHVLEEFTPEETPAIEEAICRAADAVEVWAAEGALGAMNRFNRRAAPEDASARTGPDGGREEESET